MEDEDINIGIEHVNKIEVHYCDLCRYYLPIRDDIDTRIKRHCQSRAHLKAYLQFKDDELLRQDAERLARKKRPAPKVKEEKKTDDAVKPAAMDEGGEEKKPENGDVAVAKAEGDEKMEEGEKDVNAAKENEGGDEKKVTENGKDIQDDGDELELTTADEIGQDEDQDVSDMLERSNYEDDDDSRINER